MKVAWTDSVKSNFLFTQEDLSNLPPLTIVDNEVLFPSNLLQHEDADTLAHDYRVFSQCLASLHSYINHVMCESKDEHPLDGLFTDIQNLIDLQDNDTQRPYPVDPNADADSREYAELVFSPTYSYDVVKNRRTTDGSCAGVVFFDSVMKMAVRRAMDVGDESPINLSDEQASILMMKFATTSYDLDDEMLPYYHLAREVYGALMDYTRNSSKMVIQELIPNSHNLPRCAKPSTIAIPTYGQLKYRAQDPSLMARVVDQIDIIRSYPQVRSVLVDLGDTLLSAMFRSLFSRFTS